MCKSMTQPDAQAALASDSSASPAAIPETTTQEFPDLDEEYFGHSSSSSTQELQPESPLLEAQQAQQDPPPLDETCFSSFAPLIQACQDYASLSGCRFSVRAFDGIECEPGIKLPMVSDIRAKDSGPLLSAKLRAVSSVRSFAKRIRSGELELIQDLTRAFDMVTLESARNSMIASCKAADFFPPSPAPASVDEEDCSWDAVGSSSVPVIAQRLYNDEVHRLHDIVDGRNPTLVRAKTASFVVEFADEVGVGLPQMPTDRTDMLQRFQEDLTSWTSEPNRSHSAPISVMLQNAGDLAASMAKNEQHQASLLLSMAAMTVGAVGVAVHVGARIARSSAGPGGAARINIPHQVRA